MLRVEMVDVEGTLIREAADRNISQWNMAYTYAFGIVGSEEIDWAKVNAAILEHRSMAALKNIKAIAWRHVDGR